MRSIKIPGGTAVIREGQDIRQRDRRPVISAGVAASGALGKINAQQLNRGELESMDIGALGMTLEEMDSFQDLQRAVILASLVSWSLEQPVPDADSIEDLPASLYDALATATQENTGVILQGTSFDPVDPKSAEFASSPTSLSVVSDNGSRAESESTSTKPPQTGGPSTATDASSTA